MNDERVEVSILLDPANNVWRDFSIAVEPKGDAAIYHVYELGANDTQVEVATVNGPAPAFPHDMGYVGEILVEVYVGHTDSIE